MIHMKYINDVHENMQTCEWIYDMNTHKMRHDITQITNMK